MTGKQTMEVKYYFHAFEYVAESTFMHLNT